MPANAVSMVNKLRVWAKLTCLSSCAAHVLAAVTTEDTVFKVFLATEAFELAGPAPDMDHDVPAFLKLGSVTGTSWTRWDDKVIEYQTILVTETDMRVEFDRLGGMQAADEYLPQHHHLPRGMPATGIRQANPIGTIYQCEALYVCVSRVAAEVPTSSEGKTFADVKIDIAMAFMLRHIQECTGVEWGIESTRGTRSPSADGV